MSATEIVEQIRKLPPEERREVIEHLRDEFAEVDDELTPEQAAELDRRVEEFRKNPKAGVPWEQVRAKIGKKYGWE
jgi:putative addiction module component (TIGR02574 family)